VKNEKIRLKNTEIDAHNLKVKFQNMLSGKVQNGNLLCDAGLYKEAIDCFDSVLKEDRKNTTALNTRGSTRLEMAHMTRKKEKNEALFVRLMELAIDDFSIAITINPENAVDANNLQTARSIKAGKSTYVGRGKSVTFDAEEARKVIEFYEKVRTLTSAIAEVNLECVKDRASFWMLNGLYALAIEDIDALLEAHPNHSDIKQLLSEAQLKQAKELSITKNIAISETIRRESTALYKQGVEVSKAGKHSAAFVSFMKASELVPNDPLYIAARSKEADKIKTLVKETSETTLTLFFVYC
jgi:tetratricopeptide (TPR) repeat protein